MQTYSDIISNYHKWRNNYPDTWLINCKSQSDLSSAIQVAALAENEFGKRHPHQYRLKKVNLQLFADKLIQNKQLLYKSQSFDDLYEIVASCRVHGIGILTIYDTSTRIGAFLNLLPQYIYLHAGTKKGAEKLLGPIKASRIEKDCLPEPFKSSNLTPSELEDLLCHLIHNDENHRPRVC